jgi:hypothetical protein
MEAKKISPWHPKRDHQEKKKIKPKRIMVRTV